MRKLVDTTLSIISDVISKLRGDLFEFSTSMDIDEFDVVLKHLRRSHPRLADIYTDIFKEFLRDTPIGESDRWNFAGSDGYMELEREDDQALTVTIFSAITEHRAIDRAYEKGIEELGI